MKQKTIRYLLNITLFLCLAFYQTQIIPFLIDAGYNTFDRGIILACNALFAIVLQLLFSYLCDHNKTMKKYFIIAYGFFLLSGSICFFFTNSLFFFHLLTSSMCIGLVKVLTALIETWMLHADQENYGKYRALGAIGLCIGSPFIGYIIDTYSYKGMVITCVLTSVITLYLSFRCEDAKYEESKDFKQIFQLFKNKQYMYFVAIYFLIYVVGSADQYVVIDKLTQLETSKFLIGVKWSIQSLMEIPFFLFGNKIFKKYSVVHLLLFATFMYGIKFIAYAMSPSVIWIIATSTLQLVTLPIVAYTSKLIFDSIAPELKVSSQMVAMSLFIGGSAFVTPLISSFLHLYLDTDTILYIFASLCIFPLLLTFKKRNFKTK